MQISCIKTYTPILFQSSYFVLAENAVFWVLSLKEQADTDMFLRF